MGQLIYRTYTTPGEKEPISVNVGANNTITVGAVITSGSASYAVQYTLDDLNNPDQVKRWFDTIGLPAGTTTTGTAVISFPVTGVRLNATLLGGTLELKVIQGYQR